MFNLFLFENSLKISQSKSCIYTDEDKYILSIITLLRLVLMIHNYMSLNLSSYSVKDMFKMYIEGSIEAKIDTTVITENYENICITNAIMSDEDIDTKNEKLKNLDLSSSYYDDIIYEKASKWFIYYDNDLVGVETILIKNNKCRRLSISNSDKLKEFHVATLVHIKFCFEKLGLNECYRIIKKDSQKEIEPAGIKYNAGKEDLGDYLKIRYTPSSLYGLTIQDFKEVYGL